MKTCLTFSVLVLTILASLGICQLPAAENVLPSDTVFMVSTDNISSLQASFKKTDLYGLWNDPVMKPFVSDFKKSFEKFKMVSGKFDFLDGGKEENLPTGKIAVGVLMGESVSKGEDAGVVMLMEYGKNAANIKETIEEKIKKAVSEGATRKKQNVMGVEVVTLIKERKAEGLDDVNGVSGQDKRNPFELNYGFVDDVLVVTADTDFDLMRFVISQVKGGQSGESLLKTSDYVQGMQATDLKDSLKFFVNVNKFLDLAASKAGPDAKMQMEMFGLSNVSSLVGQVNVDPKTSDLKARALLKIDGEKKGVIKMLDMKNAGVSIPDFVDSSTSSVSIFNWDVKNAFEQLKSMVMAVQPQAAMLLNMPFSSPDGKMMTVQQDLINHFGSQVVVATSYDADKKGRPQSSVFAIAVDNASKMDESIGMLHGMYLAAGNPKLKREFMGNNVYLVDFGGMMSMGQPGMESSKMPKIGITVTDSYLMIAPEEEIEKTLRQLSSGDAKSFETKPWFIEARKSIPGEVAVAGFQNNREVYEVMWDVLKEEGLSGLNSAAGEQAGSFLEMFNFSLLPKFDAVKQYFGISSAFMKNRQDGFYYEMNTMDLPK